MEDSSEPTDDWSFENRVKCLKTLRQELKEIVNFRNRVFFNDTKGITTHTDYLCQLVVKLKGKEPEGEKKEKLKNLSDKFTILVRKNLFKFYEEVFEEILKKVPQDILLSKRQFSLKNPKPSRLEIIKLLCVLAKNIYDVKEQLLLKKWNFREKILTAKELTMLYKSLRTYIDVYSSRQPLEEKQSLVEDYNTLPTYSDELLDKIHYEWQKDPGNVLTKQWNQVFEKNKKFELDDIYNLYKNSNRKGLLDYIETLVEYDKEWVKENVKEAEEELKKAQQFLEAGLQKEPNNLLRPILIKIKAEIFDKALSNIKIFPANAIYMAALAKYFFQAFSREKSREKTIEELIKLHDLIRLRNSPGADAIRAMIIGLIISMAFIVILPFAVHTATAHVALMAAKGLVNKWIIGFKAHKGALVGNSLLVGGVTGGLSFILFRNSADRGNVSGADAVRELIQTFKK